MDKDQPAPEELKAALMAEKFGTEAVLGQGAQGRGLLEGMSLALRIVRAYQARAASDDWVKWAKANPDANKLLAWASKLEA